MDDGYRRKKNWDKFSPEKKSKRLCMSIRIINFTDVKSERKKIAGFKANNNTSLRIVVILNEISSIENCPRK